MIRLALVPLLASLSFSLYLVAVEAIVTTAQAPQTQDTR